MFSVGACAVIGDYAAIGARTRIEAGAVIGEGVHIGDNCRIYPRVVVYPGCTLGNWVVVHAGVVLGADGFGYVRDPESGAYTQFPQQGTLVIEDDVEIGANCTIDRGALKETRVRRGAKFDNLVHVGHNCEIGEDAILVALTGISGSSTIGKGAVLAGQVGVGDHAHVGPGVILGGQAGVFSGKTVTNEGLKPGTVHWGTPARPLQQVLREQATLARLAKRQKKAAKLKIRSGITDAMAIIVVGGGGRGSGKTALICGLIHVLPEIGWTAVKVTSDAHNKPAPIWEETDRGEETDTGRYLAAGARRSFLVTASDGELGDVVKQVLNEHSSAPAIIFESNRVLSHVRPDLCLAAATNPHGSRKPSFALVEERMDALVELGGHDHMIEGKRMCFHLRSLDRISPPMAEWLRERLGANSIASFKANSN